MERKDGGGGELWARLHEAVYNGDVAALDAMLKEEEEGGMPVNINDQPHPLDGRQLIHSAVMGIPSQMVEYLVLEHGADVESQDDRGRTPLLLAAANGSPRLITRLVALGADEFSVDSEGCGALLLAAQAGHVRLVLWLFQGGVPPAPATDRRGPLHMAAFAGQCHPEPSECMLSKLAAIGVGLEDGTTNGFTAMHFAALGDRPEAIERCALCLCEFVPFITICFLISVYSFLVHFVGLFLWPGCLSSAPAYPPKTETGSFPYT